MKFRPLHDRVLVKRVEQDEKSAGGIIIPDTAQEKPMEGKVIAVGTGTREEGGKLTPLDVKAGDRIFGIRGSPDADPALPKIPPPTLTVGANIHK